MDPTEGPHFYWMSIAAIGFLMIPFFFMSWWIEGFFIKKMLGQSLKPKAYQASFYANLVSYTFLEFCILIYLIKTIIQYNF